MYSTDNGSGPASERTAKTSGVVDRQRVRKAVSTTYSSSANRLPSTSAVLLQTAVSPTTANADYTAAQNIGDYVPVDDETVLEPAEVNNVFVFSSRKNFGFWFKIYCG
jgi:hypothetical protein